MDQEQSRQHQDETRRRRRVPLTVTLAASFGLLVFLAVSSVLAVGLWTGTTNTAELLRDKAEIGIAAVVERIALFLDPVAEQTRFLARRVAAGELAPADGRRLRDALAGALSAAPQVAALYYLDADGRASSASRVDDMVEFNAQTLAEVPDTLQAIARELPPDEGGWLPPRWLPQFGGTAMLYARTVRQDGEVAGALVAVVPIKAFSADLGAPVHPSIAGATFVLYGNDRVLAHAAIAAGRDRTSPEAPLPALATFSDPVLSSLWQDRFYPLEIPLTEGTSGRAVPIGDDVFIFVYRQVFSFGGVPWTVGVYLNDREVGQERQRLITAGWIGLGALGLSILAAYALARLIARPIVGLAEAASQVGRLEIGQARQLPHSLIRELDEQARAFNAMLRALRWFEVYVPKALVARLLQRQESNAVSSDREVTVMFTDIVGFTAFAEGKTGQEVAALLNEHFALVARAVEDEDGTVDKFIGDALMAFWGAPDEMPDHAARACRAARAAGLAAAAFNADRQARGEPPVRMRIGLHSGTVTVGNIGAPGRMNYTIVGDAVNVAQRLEESAREHMAPGMDAAIVASSVTVELAGESGEPIGPQQVKGRAEPVPAFLLR